MDTQIQIHKVDIPLRPWLVSEDGQNIKPIPGTWTLAPHHIIATKKARAIVSCPNCRTMALVNRSMGTLVEGVLQLSSYRCSGCEFVGHLRLQGWDTKKLYCIAYKVWPEQKFTDSWGNETVTYAEVPEERKMYTHANTRQEAVFAFSQSAYGKWEFMDCGLVVGFFGLESDRDQKVLYT